MRRALIEDSKLIPSQKLHRHSNQKQIRRRILTASRLRRRNTWNANELSRSRRHRKNNCTPCPWDRRRDGLVTSQRPAAPRNYWKQTRRETPGAAVPTRSRNLETRKESKRGNRPINLYQHFSPVNWMERFIFELKEGLVLMNGWVSRARPETNVTHLYLP